MKKANVMRLKSDKSQFSSLLRVVTIALVPLALAACNEPKAAQEPVRPVKAFVIPAPQAERTLTYSGVIAPRIESQLGFRVAGKIMERFVNAGDRVLAGQRIARLDEQDSEARRK